jgi:hypothetical protein
MARLPAMTSSQGLRQTSPLSESSKESMIAGQPNMSWMRVCDIVFRSTIPVLSFITHYYFYS